MAKFLSFEFWNTVARLILRNRTVFLVIIAGITIFLASQWQHMKFSHTEANLLPDDHEVNLQYNDFVKQFGEEGNVVVMAVSDSSLFSPSKFAAWNELAENLREFEVVETTISIGDLKKLQKFQDPPRFEMVPLIAEEAPDSLQIQEYREEIFNRLPFYEGLVFSNRLRFISTRR